MERIKFLWQALAIGTRTMASGPLSVIADLAAVLALLGLAVGVQFFALPEALKVAIPFLALLGLLWEGSFRMWRDAGSKPAADDPADEIEDAEWAKEYAAIKRQAAIDDAEMKMLRAMEPSDDLPGMFLMKNSKVTFGDLGVESDHPISMATMLDSSFHADSGKFKTTGKPDSSPSPAPDADDDVPYNSQHGDDTER